MGDKLRERVDAALPGMFVLALLACGSRADALRVRLIRARRPLEDYLGPRCGHLAARNFCSCAGRLGVALAAGFVELPAGPAPPPDAVPPAGHVVELYRSLAVQLDERLRGELLAALSHGPVE